MAACHPAAAREAVSREPQALDAKRRGVFHHNAKNGRMQMQMQVAIDMVQRQAGRAEFCKLRVDLRTQWFPQTALKKVAETGGDGFIVELTTSIDQPGDLFRRQGGTSAHQRQMQTHPEFWIFARDRDRFIETRLIHHQTGSGQNAFTMRADDGLID